MSSESELVTRRVSTIRTLMVIDSLFPTGLHHRLHIRCSRRCEWKIVCSTRQRSITFRPLVQYKLYANEWGFTTQRRLVCKRRYRNQSIRRNTRTSPASPIPVIRLKNARGQMAASYRRETAAQTSIAQFTCNRSLVDQKPFS